MGTATGYGQERRLPWGWLSFDYQKKAMQDWPHAAMLQAICDATWVEQRSTIPSKPYVLTCCDAAARAAACCFLQRPIAISRWSLAARMF
jgi:hypothetical protein